MPRPSAPIASVDNRYVLPAPECPNTPMFAFAWRRWSNGSTRRRAHADQLPLQVTHDPRGRERNGMPGQAHGETGRQQAEEPCRIEVGSGQTLDIPGTTETARVLKARSQFSPEDSFRRRLGGVEPDAHLAQRSLQALRVPRHGHHGRGDAV